VSIDTVTLSVTKLDGDTLDLAPIAKEVEIIEGRSDSSFFDAPGSCVVRVYMEDDTITRTNYTGLYGASLTVVADGVRVFAGRITSVSIQPDEELDNNWIQIQAYSIDYRISAGDTLEGALAITLETEADYTLLGAHATESPSSFVTVGTTDGLILVYNNNNETIMVWERLTGERKEERDAGAISALAQVLDSIPDQCTFDNNILTLGWDIERTFHIPWRILGESVGPVTGMAFSSQDLPEIVTHDSILIAQMPTRMGAARGYTTANEAASVRIYAAVNKWVVPEEIDTEAVGALRGFVTGVRTPPPTVSAKPNPWLVGTYVLVGSTPVPVARIDGQPVGTVRGLVTRVPDPPPDIPAIVARSWKVPATIGVFPTLVVLGDTVGIAAYTPEGE